MDTKDFFLDEVDTEVVDEFDRSSPMSKTVGLMPQSLKIVLANGTREHFALAVFAMTDAVLGPT